MNGKWRPSSTDLSSPSSETPVIDSSSLHLGRLLSDSSSIHLSPRRSRSQETKGSRRPWSQFVIDGV
ncbi:hypothetical protein CsatA_018644 [Cannabis sativa]